MRRPQLYQNVLFHLKNGYAVEGVCTNVSEEVNKVLKRRIWKIRVKLQEPAVFREGEPCSLEDADGNLHDGQVGESNDGNPEDVWLHVMP